MGATRSCAVRALFCYGIGAIICALAAPAVAQTLVQRSTEVRMQLDFVVPDAALRAFLPAGFEPNVAGQGPAKDCNLRMIFIDQVDITKPDGGAAEPGSNQLVQFAIPIKRTATDTLGQMLIFGLTADAKDAPGPFGVYVHAGTSRMTRSTTSAAGKPTITEEHWQFAAASGEHIEMNLKYARGPARRSAQDTMFFSSANPDVSEIFKIEQGLDIMRNATVAVGNRVSEFSYQAAGGKIAPLFDGSERVVSIDALHWYNRAVYRP